MSLPAPLRILLVAAGLLVAPPLAAGEGATVKDAGNGSHRWITAGSVQVDSITGAVETSYPIGPTLPGRIPLGITWHHTADEGGGFDLFKWPTAAQLEGQSRVNVTVHQQVIPLLRQSTTPSPAMVRSLLEARGVTTLPDPMLPEGFHFVVAWQRVSPDGGTQLLNTVWVSTHGTYTPDAPPPDTAYLDRKVVLLHGDLAYVLPVEDAGPTYEIPRAGVTKVLNRWGDWVEVDRSADAAGILTGLTLTSSRPGQSLTLSGGGTQWTVTPSADLGLDPVTVTALAGGTPGDVLPTRISNGLQADATFAWSGDQIQSFTAPGGATFTFTWGSAVARPGPEGFALAGEDSPDRDPVSGLLVGQWKGYEPVVKDGAYQVGVLVPTVNRITASGGPGEPGYQTTISRVQPVPSSYSTSARSITWTSRTNTVRITTDAGEAGTRFTTLRLAEPWADGAYGAPFWPGTGQPAQSLAAQQQMLLFTLGTVLQEESGTLVGGVEQLSERVTQDGWTLRTHRNPTGALDGEVGWNPVPTRTTTERPGLDGPTVTRELSAWDGTLFTQVREGTDPPSTVAPTPALGAARWRGYGLAETDLPQPFVLRTLTSHATWNPTLLTLQMTDSSSALAGSGLGTLRVLSGTDLGPAGPTDLGTKTYAFDDQQRLHLLTATTGTFISTLTNTYVPGGPEIADTVRTLNGTADMGEQGEAYAWDGPFRTGARQKPDPRASSEHRDSSGRLTSLTTADGVTTSFPTYDGLGRLRVSIRGAVAGASALTTTTEYAADGRSTTVTSASQGDSVEMTKRWDAFGRTVAVVSQPATAGRRGVFSRYDGFGQKTFESLPLRQADSTPGDVGTTFTYAADGFLLKTTNPRGGTRSFSRSYWGTLDGATGFLSTITTSRSEDPSQNVVTTVLRDLLGQVRRTRDGSGVITRSHYDGLGHLVRVERGEQVRRYRYNEIGWLLEQVQPEEGTTTYSGHTLAGSPLNSTRGGITLSIHPSPEPENAGLPGELVASGAASWTRTFTYANRRLHSLTEQQPMGTLREEYDYTGLGQLCEKTTNDGTRAFTIRRTFDAWGAVATVTYPEDSLGTVTYAKDSAQRPSTVTSADQTLAKMDYGDGDSQDWNRLTLGNGASTTWRRDSHQDVAQITHKLGGTVLEDAAMGWDHQGHLTSRGQDAYSYDALGRLRTSTTQGLAAGESVSQTFTYDAYGNRTGNASTYTAGSGSAQPEEVMVWTTSYDPATNRLPSMVHGPAGDLVTGAIYDTLGRMTSVLAVPNNQGKFATSWGYDALGRVVSETVEGVSRTFLLDGQGLRFKRWEADGTVRYTVYGFDREPLAQFEDRPQVVLQGRTSLAGAAAPGKRMASPPRLQAAVAPAVTITAPTNGLTVLKGVPVTFQGSTNMGGSLAWTFGDGGTGDGESLVHAFTDPGIYTVTLKTSYLGDMVCKKWGPPDPETGERPCLQGSYPTVWIATSLTVTVIAAPTIVSLSATPAAIYQGDSSMLAWTVTGATSLSLDNGIGAVAGSGRAVSPSGTTTYLLTATNTVNGVSATTTASVSVTVQPRPTVPTIQAFTADAGAVAAGSGTTLRWAVSNAVGVASVTLNGAPVATSGALGTGGLVTTTLYTLTAVNALDPSKTVSAHVTVTVVKVPEIALTATPTAVYAGGGSTLSWSVGNSPTSVSLDQGVGTVPATGSRLVSPQATTTYTLTASNLAGTVTASVTLSVTPKPSITAFTAAPAQINQGGSTILAWVVQGASSLQVNGITVTGSTLMVSPGVTTTYTLVASNGAGDSTPAQVTVTVVVPASFKWTKAMVYGFGQLLCERTPTGTTYLQTDQVGSVSFLTQADGSQGARVKNLPFGERFGPPAGSCSQRFASHEDQPGSAIYAQARMYLPAYGKFAQPDPAHQFSMDGLNLYTYCSNNPVTRLDPTGMRDLGSGDSASPWNNDRPHDPRAMRWEAQVGEDLGPNTVAVGFWNETPLDMWVYSSLKVLLGTKVESTAVEEVSQTGVKTEEVKHAMTLSEEGSKGNVDRRNKIAEVAWGYNGVTDLAYKPSDPGTCNIFVAGVVEEAGAPKPLVTKADGTKAIPGASEWATSPVSNWRFLKKGEAPAPGDIAAVPNRGRPGLEAHALVVYNTDGGRTRAMESGRNSVHPRDITGYTDVVYRRYIGD